MKKSLIDVAIGLTVAMMMGMTGCASIGGNASNNQTPVVERNSAALPGATGVKSTVTPGLAGAYDCSFTLPLTSKSMTVPILAFKVSGNAAITAYCVTTTNICDGCSWSSSVPTYVTFSKTGVQAAYAWAKDAAGIINAVATASVNIGRFPLSIHSSGRYLVDSGGNPFRLNMESTWLMPSFASSADVDTYISSRMSKGFNTFIIMAPTPNLSTLSGIPNQPATPPATATGLNPFTGTVGDFRNVYSEPYWAWIDTIVDKAAAAGMMVVIAPAYFQAQAGGGAQGVTATRSWAVDIYNQANPTSGNSAVNTQAVMYAYGQWLGTRYGVKGNVIWLAAGDYVFSNGSEGNIRGHKIIDGIRNTSPGAISLFQGIWPDSMPDDYTDWKDMDIRSFYSLGPGENGQNFTTADRAWTTAPIRPTLMFEPKYYDPNTPSTRPTARRELWWGVTAGSITGDHSAIAGYTEAVGYPTWANYIEDGFSYDRAYLFSLFASVPWYDMLPSGIGGGRLGKTLITSGGGTGPFTITSQATADGKNLVAYVPPTGPGARTFSVNMTAMYSPARARWYNPTSGVYIPIGLNFANTGTRQFTTPGDNGSGTNDWILQMDSNGDTTAPAVAITAPINNAAVSGTVAITATASDNVGVSRVEFYENGAFLSAINVAPYTYNWDTTSVANGSHSLTAKAYDAAGNVGQSLNITITVNNTLADTTAPTVSVTVPANNSTVSGTATVTATASDNVGVTKVELYVNGTLKATDTTAPYNYAWNTKNVVNGNYTLTAKAYDAAGNVGQSGNITVAVNNTVADTTAPTVSVTAPANNSTVSGTATVTATASDNVGVTKVEFYVNGALNATDTTAPYNYAWNTKNVANGNYTLTAKAYDAAGNVGQSGNVVINVNNPVPDIIAPTVSITAPVNNATVNKTVTITATASDNVGVTKVEFYLNGSLFATVTKAPYSFSVVTTSADNGRYTLTAKAYDAAGNVGQSGEIVVTVKN